MRTRSRAIQTAISRYNIAAGQLVPPRPSLDWARIAKYNFVEEFNLLRSARRDISEDRWSNPEVREAMKMHQRIKRAKEEVERVHIEMRRLHTSILDEHDHFARTLQQLDTAEGHQLYAATVSFCQKRRRMNRVVLSHLDDITRMKGYTGEIELRGVRLGASVKNSGREVVSDALYDHLEPDSDTDSDQEDEEEVKVGGVVDFLTNLSVS